MDDPAALSVSAPCENARPARPASDVSAGVGLVGVLALLGWVVVCRWWAGPEVASGPLAALCGLGVTGLAMAVWSVVVDKVHRRASTGIDWANPRGWRAVAGISAVKLVGLWATWGAMGAAYCLFRFYWAGAWVFAIRVMAAGVVPLLALSVPYVWWLDRVLREPRDGAWHCGAWVLGREGADVAQVVLHARCWAVKGFFIAFMLSIVPGGFARVVEFDLVRAGDPVALVGWVIDALFMVDVQIGTVGYLLTLRVLDAHIRSANPHGDGWVAALICYPPFVLMGAGGVLDYHSGTAEWSVWMAGHPILLWAWGAWLVALTGVYAWATVAFGLRFSNLTYRGVITHGPYRWTRHPAYLAKNLFWWSSTLPFLVVGGSLVEGLRNCAMLAMVSAVYYWRAKTEERHLLAEDAGYRVYWQWAEVCAPVTQGLRRVI